MLPKVFGKKQLQGVHAMRSINITFCLLLIFAFLASPLWAANQEGLEAVGEVVAVRGKVAAVNRAGEQRNLTMKDQIYDTDTIHTGERGRIQLMFKDKTIISLGRKTVMEIASYFWDPARNQGEMKTRIKEGVFRVMGGAITKASPEKFTTETPTGTIGIRGSMFAGRVTADTLAVVFQGGTGIYVQNAYGMVEIDRPGYGTHVRGPNLPPEPPVLFTPEEISEITRALYGRSISQEGAPDRFADEPLAELTDDPLLDEVLVEIESTTETVGAISTVSSQEDPQLTTALPAVIHSMSGSYHAIMADMIDTSGVGDNVWSGDIVAELQDNDMVSGSEDTLLDADFVLDVAAYDPTAGYSLPELSSTERVINLLGTDRTLWPQFVWSSNMGEFFVFATGDTFIEVDAEYDFRELGFMGVEATSVPIDGVDVYSSFTGGALCSEQFTATGNIKPLTSSSVVAVNWYNNKVMGRIGGEVPGERVLYFFADLSGTGLTNITVLGSHHDDQGTASASDDVVNSYGGGGTSFGQFYGSAYQGFGFTSEGSIADLSSATSPAQVGTWDGITGAFRDPSLNKPASDTGTVTWSGAMVGIAEIVDNPTSARRIFMPETDTDFSLTINRDTGQVTGSITLAPDVNDLNNNISDMTIGGAYGSAYISPEAFIAALGCTGGDCIDISGTTGDLKAQGNYLVTAKAEDQFAQYATWGYWEIAYEDLSSSQQYRLYVPGSLWIAGETTPQSYINGLVTANATGQYVGSAKGSWIHSDLSIAQLTNGQFTLDVDFASAASSPASGSIQFSEVNMTLSRSVDVNTSYFTVDISTPDSGAGIANLTLFGPNAQSIGGQFNATDANGQYVGIVGGDLQ